MAKPKRKGSRSSTPFLAFWGVAMLLLGLGMGLVMSNQGCGRRKAKPVESQEDSPAPRKTRPRGPASEGADRADEHRKGEPQNEPKTEAKPETKRDAKSEAKPVLPRLALVIDDLGYASPELVRRLCAQPIPFSAAVLPFQEYTQMSARIVHEAGKEVLLHLPMEPIGYPGSGKDPGQGAVLFAQTESETRSRVRKALLAVPWRKGVNNHMGSRITPDRQRMAWVLQEIKQAGCFFVDSRTEKDSVAYDVAESLHIPSIQRKVFLDDNKAFEEIAKQWERALGIAHKDGQVLIIGHIYPETVEALEKLVPRSQGQIAFVRASELAR